MDIHEELSRRWVKTVRVFVDEASCTATFLLYGLFTQKLLGYQTYNPKSLAKKVNDPRLSRYYTYQPRVKQSGDYAVFGTEYVQGSDLLFVTEGIFEAVRLLEMGYDAIAILCSSPPEELVTELHRRWERVVWCGDNDPAGNKSSMAKNSLRMYFEEDLDETDQSTLLERLDTFRRE